MSIFTAVMVDEMIRRARQEENRERAVRGFPPLQEGAETDIFEAGAGRALVQCVEVLKEQKLLET